MLPPYALNIDKKKITHNSNRARQANKNFWRYSSHIQFYKWQYIFLLFSIRQIFIMAYFVKESKDAISKFKETQTPHKIFQCNPDSTSVLRYLLQILSFIYVQE